MVGVSCLPAPHPCSTSSAWLRALEGWPCGGRPGEVSAGQLGKKRDITACHHPLLPAPGVLQGCTSLWPELCLGAPSELSALLVPGTAFSLPPLTGLRAPLPPVPRLGCFPLGHAQRRHTALCKAHLGLRPTDHGPHCAVPP